MAGKAQEIVGSLEIPDTLASIANDLKPLSIHVVSDNVPLRDGLSQVALTHSAGPLDFQFWARADGLQPLLEPGLDAVVVDIAMGNAADLAFLGRVIALGPNAPVVAIGVDDPDIQLQAIKAGAEDCLSPDHNSPRNLALSLRRAVARWELRDARAGTKAHASADKPKVTLVQEASDAIVILDNRGLVRFINNAAEELLGRENSDLIGKPFGLPSEVGEHDVAVMRPDGDNRYAEMRIVETRWGGTPALVAALTDVTVRRKLEQTILDAQAKSHTSQRRAHKFFSSVNHDLRTPLTHIIGFSELMKNEQFGPMGQDRYRDYANDIHSSGTMLLDMIEDLLGIAEVETDEINLTDEICNLRQLIDITVASQRNQARTENVTLEIDCPERLPGFRGDAKRLRQGLFRLIAEAIHCARPGATLRFVARETDKGLNLSIIETLQTGDSAVMQSSLPYLPDDPFVSSENSGIARDESLSLSLTRKIMELHGGKLEVIKDHDADVTISLSFPADRIIR